MRYNPSTIRNTLGAIAGSLALACGGGGGPTNPPPPPPPTDNAPTITINAPSTATEDNPVNISYQATDDKGLTEIRINFGDGNSTTIPATGTNESGSVPHTYQSPGPYTIRGTATDNKPQTSKEATDDITINELVVPDSSLVTVNSTYFFNQETNETIELTFNKTGTQETLQITQGTGTIKLENGEYQLTINDPDNQHTDGSQLTYIEEEGGTPGEHLIFDKQQISQPITINQDKTYKTVTIKEGKFLKDMAQQWLNNTKVPMPGDINLVLYASGNPTCPEEWTPERDDPNINTCGDTETWPPGKPMTQEQIDNFLDFVEDTKENFSNPIIPWQPYNIREILADSISIRNYVSSVNSNALAEVKTPNTHVIIGVGGAPFRERSQSEMTGSINTIFASSGTANGNNPYQYPNEMQLFGSVIESLNYDVCSIRDHEEDGWLPGCEPTETLIYQEFDRKAHAVVAAYLTRAQSQPNAFNVRLPEP